MTQWVETVEGGRDRGARGLVRAWFEVLTRPRRFFATGVAPGDQAPGLVFAIAVATAAATSWLATDAQPPPLLADTPAAGALLSVVVIAGFVAPVALHLVAAVQTVALVAALPPERRAGVSETVQVLAYATAPCALAGLPIPPLRLVCTVYGAGLFVVGMSVRHDLGYPGAALVSHPSIALAFAYAYRGYGAATWLVDLLRTALL
jgi:hypothetical protein